MQIKIKDLPELIKGMDPEAVLTIGGGHVDYSTSDVELVESDGYVTVQESSRIRTERYSILDVPNDISESYDNLVQYKSYAASLSEMMHIFDASFSGAIVIDALLSSGNSSNRFLQASVVDGKIDHKSVQIVETKRQDPIRVFSNQHLQQDPDSVDASVLNTAQKKILLAGISI